MIKMMKEGYIYSDSIELVLDEVVEIATTGYEECVGGAVGALNHLNMKKWKNKIIQLVIFYTENNLKDKAVFHYSWHLLYRLGFKQALIDYVEKYEEYMEGELDEEYGEVLETVVIEDIFMPPILKLLSENKEQQLLEDIFRYFEEIVNSDDIQLINIFVITVLEILGNDKLILEKTKQYMGTKTTVLQAKADEELGRA